MSAGVSAFLRLIRAEGPLGLEGGPSEDQTALIDVINDAMTSWWAQAVAIGMFAAIALLLFRSLRRDDGSGPPVERRKARNSAIGVLVALAMLVVAAAALRPGPLVFVEYVILFTVLSYLIIRNMAPAVLGAGDAIMWVFSPTRRRRFREETAAQEASRGRGDALQQVLAGALDDARSTDAAQPQG